MWAGECVTAATASEQEEEGMKRSITSRYSVHLSVYLHSYIGGVHYCRVVKWWTMQYIAVQLLQYSSVQYSAVRCGTVQYSAVQCSAVQCSALQSSAVQCSAVQCTAGTSSPRPWVKE